MKVVLLNGVLLAALFVAWCVLDYCVVKSARFPQNSHDYDWTFVLVPLFTAAVNSFAQRRRGLVTSMIAAIVAAASVSLIFVVMLIFFGISFHLSIGGRL